MIVPIFLNRDIWLLYGETMVNLEKQGQKMSDFDLLIACTARIYNLTLATNDLGFEVLPKSFERVNWVK
jgi:predicted nucleic acid-binding protein